MTEYVHTLFFAEALAMKLHFSCRQISSRMERYTSVELTVVEHWTADRKVRGSNVGALFFRELKRNIVLRISKAGCSVPFCIFLDKAFSYQFLRNANQWFADTGCIAQW
ncbi:hypothetical protein TNCV_512211 [Trichonephila clavipes]|nr:hypothetical protein TNCV_512211 [Trichonephila clavipes]